MDGLSSRPHDDDQLVVVPIMPMAISNISSPNPTPATATTTATANVNANAKLSWFQALGVGLIIISIGTALVFQAASNVRFGKAVGNGFYLAFWNFFLASIFTLVPLWYYREESSPWNHIRLKEAPWYLFTPGFLGSM